MRALDELNSKMASLKLMGEEARALAQKANVSAYFIDPDDNLFILEEKPDGSVVRSPRNLIAGILAAE